MLKKKSIDSRESFQLEKIKKFVNIQDHTSKEALYELHKNTKDFFYNFLFDKIINVGSNLYFNKCIYPKIKKEEINSAEHQEKILSDIVQKMRNTEIGKYHRINQNVLHDPIHIYEHFSKEIPIQDYDEYEGRIELSKKKENVVWPGQVHRFSASSGATSSRKHIPITQESMESSSKAGIYMFAEYAHKNPNTKIFQGDFWPLIGSIQHYDKENEIAIADVSALLTLARNKVVHQRYAFDSHILLEHDREVKRDLFLKHLNANRKVTIMGVTSRVYEMLRYIKEQDPQKFEKVKKNIQLVIGGGVDVAPYIHDLKAFNIDYVGIYNASESYFGYQDIINYDNSNGGAPYKFVTNHGVFYEFVELNDDNFDAQRNIKEDAKAKPLSAITQKDWGKKFALVITANNGLLRYLIGDVVKFVGDNRFHITGRTKQSLNLKGKELMETHITNVFYKLQDLDGIDIKHYTIAPDQEQNPTRHERIVEVENMPTNPEILTQKIDEYLKGYNADYQAKRKRDILLKLPQGTFYTRLQSKERLGGQFKIPKLSHKRTHIEEILSLIAK